MRVENITFDNTTSVLSMTFVPDPANPNEVAATGCAYAILMAFPDDQATAAKYILAVCGVLMVDGLPEDAAAVDQLRADPKAMDAIRSVSPEVADKIANP